MLKDNLVGQKKVLKLERNCFILQLEAKRKQGMSFFFHYLNSQGETWTILNHLSKTTLLEYKALYQHELDAGTSVQPTAERRKEKAKKTCRVKA